MHQICTFKRQSNWRLSPAMFSGYSFLWCHPYLSVHTAARCSKHPLIGGRTIHSSCLGSCLATILTTKEVMSYAPKRPTAGTILGCMTHSCLCLCQSPRKPDWLQQTFHQLLLWLDVQSDVFKQLQLPIPLHTFKDFSLSAQINLLPLTLFPSHSESKVNCVKWQNWF